MRFSPPPTPWLTRYSCNPPTAFPPQNTRALIPPSPPGPRASSSHPKTASPHIPPCVARCLLCRCSGLRNLTFRFRSPLLQPVDYPHVALLQPYKWARLSGPVSLTFPHICRLTTQSPLILVHNTAHQVQQARMTGFSCNPPHPTLPPEPLRPKTRVRSSPRPPRPSRLLLPSQNC